MIDIVERIVVPCPPDCDYVALSYVWGGVEPSPGSLKNRCLPQTIEDAITVTQALGRRYLWVDALCINQSEELTSSERKEKEKQLRWMGIIYGGATVTIVAVSGLNANAGLHGISVPRLAQVTENIDGYTLFTSPPSYFTETSETLWSRRAWTMQEHLLSKRLLFFSQSQVAFECREGLFEEVLHYTTKGDTIIDDTPHPSTSEDSLTRFLYGDEVNPDSDETPWRRLLIFSRLLGIYTIRQMTKESDSINAFRGMLTTLGAQLFPGGFVHGLPLKSHPNSLAWMHLDGVIPQRRAQFPSWSWAGWEGAVVFPEKLLANSDINAASENFTNIDLGSQFLASEGNEISVEGWVVYLDIRTDPLSELFVPGQRDSVGTVKEGHSFHNNTLNTGIYTCLVIQRLAEPTWGLDSRREIVFLLALQQTGSKIQRRTQLTVTLFRSQSFDQIPREKKVLQLT
ncbi:Heterokaryon incompatibility [Penicillium expansum]|nr:Heterokaryon incompatibility [Penicillium expansum]